MEKKKKKLMGPNNAFGPIFIAAAPPVTYFIDYNYIYTINVSWIQKKKKKNSIMAQTMPDVLFGPVFIAAAPPVTYFIDYNYILTINIS